MFLEDAREIILKVDTADTWDAYDLEYEKCLDWYDIPYQVEDGDEPFDTPEEIFRKLIEAFNADCVKQGQEDMQIKKVESVEL